MNFTGTLRNYFSEHKGEIFDVGFEQKHAFGMIDIKIMNRLLNRLEGEGIIIGVSKGVYYINDGNECTEEKIIDYYLGFDGSCGMMLGNSLFYEFGLIYEKPDITTVLSGKTCINRHIGNIFIEKTKSHLVNEKEILTVLEIYEKLKVPYDPSKLFEIVKRCCKVYHDIYFKSALSTRMYKYSTVMKLAKILDDAHVENNVLKIYEEVTM